MFYEKDNNIFFKDFGIKANKNGNEFFVIFDISYNESSIFSTFNSINNSEIFSYVNNKDLKEFNIKVKDILVINNKSYIIKNIKFDNNGISEIQLQIFEG